MVKILDEPTEVLKQAVKEIHDNRRMLVLLIAMASTRPFSLKGLRQRLSWTDSQLKPPLKRLCQLNLVVKTAKRNYMLVGVPSPEIVAKAVRCIRSDDTPKVEIPTVVLPTESDYRTTTTPEPVITAAVTNTAVVKGSPAAVRIATQFKVPVKRAEGEACLGPIHPCNACKTPSPLRYGTTPICYKCARKEEA